MIATWQRVLLVRTDKVGDLLLTMPAVRAVRDALPHAHLTLVASPYNSVAVVGWDAVDEVCRYDPKWPAVARVRTVRRLRGARPDACLVFSPGIESYLVARLSGAPVRVGLVYSRRVLDRLFSPLVLTSSAIEHVDEAVAAGRPARHLVDQAMTVVSRAGLPGGRGDLEIVREPEAMNWASALVGDCRTRGGHVIAMHLSEKWFESGWSANDVRALVERLAAAVPGCAIFLTCGIADGTAESTLRAGDEPAGGATIVSVDFARWTALFARSDVVVTRDTGAIHLASAVGRPVVAIYARDGFQRNSQQFAPWRVAHRIVRDGPFEEVASEVVNGVVALAACQAGTQRSSASN